MLNSCHHAADVSLPPQLPSLVDHQRYDQPVQARCLQVLELNVDSHPKSEAKLDDIDQGLGFAELVPDLPDDL